MVAVGNGTRGSVFAAYALAEHLLGVAPFYRFTAAQPLYTTGLSEPCPQQGSPMVWGPPAFKHR